MPSPKPAASPKMRKVRLDAVLSEAVGIARKAAEQESRFGNVGEHLGVQMESQRLLTHFFASREPGYKGWKWAVTLSRVPRSRDVTVCEITLIPGEGALLAPKWVPIRERMAALESGENLDETE